MEEVGLCESLPFFAKFRIFKEINLLEFRN